MKVKSESRFRHTKQIIGYGGLSIEGETGDECFNVQVEQNGDQRESSTSAAVRIPVEEFWDLISKLPGAPLVLCLVLVACGGESFSTELFATGGAGGQAGAAGTAGAAGEAGGTAGAAGAHQDAGEDACETVWTLSAIQKNTEPWVSGDGFCWAKAVHCGVEPGPPEGYGNGGPEAPGVCAQDDDTNKIITFCKPCSGTTCEECSL